MVTSLSLRMLGPWQAELNGRPLPPLPTRHTRVLLARLAMTHPQPIPRWRLQHDFFPGTEDERAARHLRTTLYYLRRALGQSLVTAAAEVMLDPALQIAHDVARFEAYTAPGATQAMLESAVQLYHGPFLNNPAEGWGAREAQRLHGRYLDSLRRLVALNQAAGTPGRALEAAQRWVAEAPWEEEAHVALINAWYVRGNRLAAEAQISRARALLRAEWGQPPSQTFEVLARRIARMSHVAPPPPAAPRVNPPTDPTEFNRLPVIGRETELARLWELWLQVQHGPAQEVTLEGVAGVGKTRLVSELAARVRLRGGNLVLSGTAGEQAPNQNFSLLRETLLRPARGTAAALRRAGRQLDAVSWSVAASCLPELAHLLPDRPLTSLPPLEGVAETARRQTALLTLFAQLSTEGPLLLVLEDVHWADDQSLAVVAELLRRGERMLVIFTRRPGTERGSENVLLLSPLNEAATQELFRRALGSVVDEALLNRLVPRSGGNPLFVRELLHALNARDALQWEPHRGWHLVQPEMALPGAITELLAERLNSLSPDARQLAGLLAVLGRPVESELLERLWPEPSLLATQAELLEHAVLAERNGRLTFDHDWLRESCLAGLDELHRRDLHQQLALALSGDPQADPAERMVHYAGAGAWEAALTDSLAAAQEALAETHLAVLEQALSVAEQAMSALAYAPDDPRRWELLRLRERYHALTDRGPVWQADFEAMKALAAANGRQDWLVEGLNRHGRALREQGEVAEAEDRLYRAATVAREAKLFAAEAEARLNLVYALTDRNVVDNALAEAEAAVSAAEQADDEWLHIRTLGALAYAQMRAGQHEAAIALQLDLLDNPLVENDLASSARLMRHLAITYMAAREYEAGFHWARKSVDTLRSVGDLHAILICQSYLFHELTNFGLYAEARPLGEATLELAEQLNVRIHLFWAIYNLARLHGYAGELDRARPLAQRAAEIGEALTLADEISAGQELVARLALAAGRLNQARVAIERGRQMLAGQPTPNWLIAPTAARVWLALGDKGRAGQAAHEGVAQASQSLNSQYGSVVPSIQALWESASVLEQLEGRSVARPLQTQAYLRFVDDVSRLSSPEVRRAFLNANPAHRALSQFNGMTARRLVLLPLEEAPTGRPLHLDELVPVVWTIDAAGDAGLETPLGRRQRLQRLAAEAVAQGAVATIEALAVALSVSSRTIQRDLQRLRSTDVTVITRGSVRSDGG